MSALDELAAVVEAKGYDLHSFRAHKTYSGKHKARTTEYWWEVWVWEKRQRGGSSGGIWWGVRGRGSTIEGAAQDTLAGLGQDDWRWTDDPRRYVLPFVLHKPQADDEAGTPQISGSEG